MSDTPTTRAKAKMAKDRDTNGSDVRDIDAFRLDIIEAFKDPSVAEQMAAAFAPHLERIADKMCERLDAKVKVMTQQLQARDHKIQSLENTVNILQLKIDDQEQYSRRESLRISGIPETASENTDQLVMTFCNVTPLYKIPIWQGPIDLVTWRKLTELFWLNFLPTKFVIVLSGQGQTLKTSTKTMTTQFI